MSVRERLQGEEGQDRRDSDGKSENIKRLDPRRSPVDITIKHRNAGIGIIDRRVAGAGGAVAFVAAGIA